MPATRRIRAAAFPLSIFIAGDIQMARAALREFCMEGLCVTLTPTEYIYTAGAEDGLIVGLINYPRFPKEPEELLAQARRLAEFLMDRLFQSSCTVQTPTETIWHSRRVEA